MSLPSPPPPPSTHGDPSDEGTRNTEDDRRWGLGEVWIGLLMSQAVATALAVVAIAAGGWDTVTDAPLWMVGLLTVALEGTLLGVALWAAANKGNGARADYRITTKLSDPAVGLVAGVLTQLVLVPAVTLPILWLTDTDMEEVSKAARELTDRATSPVGVITLVVAVGIIAPIVEEIFFRGLIFGAFAKRRNMRWLEHALPQSVRPDTTAAGWNTAVAFVFSSLIFGAIHFQLILIPALAAAGAVFAWLAHRSGRLGPAIWAHAAFNATTLVNLLLL